MTDKELNERLAVKCGWQQLAFNSKPEKPCGLWASPDGGVIFCPNFVHDMNACDKWIVPVLRNLGLREINFQYRKDGNIECFIFTEKDFNIGETNGLSKTESEAFCVAADKCLEELK